MKQWQELPDGRRFLLESVSWLDLQPALLDLPEQEAADARGPAKHQHLASARVWPAAAPVAQTRQEKEVEVAGGPYRAKGVLLDFDLSGSATSFTFTNGVTFFIPNSFSMGAGAAIFQPACVVKHAANAYLLLFGTVSFPVPGSLMPVFTQKDDDLFGDKITGSTGNPSIANGAAQAIWIYYLTGATTLSNARIRYAQRGVQYDANAGVIATHTVSDCLFQNCTTGI